MASQGEKTTAKDEGEAKSTPSNQEVAPPLVSSTKGIMFLFVCDVLLASSGICYRNIFFYKACFSQHMINPVS